MLGLPAATPDQAVESYAAAVERLRATVGIPTSFQAAGRRGGGVPRPARRAVAMNAYDDQCAPANPRMPMLDDMQELMRGLLRHLACRTPARAARRRRGSEDQIGDSSPVAASPIHEQPRRRVSGVAPPATAIVSGTPTPVQM